MTPSATNIPTRKKEKIAGTFQQDTWTAFVAVRTALADFVASIPGELKRPTDLQRALELDSKICWQIFNVIRSEDSMSSARHVPTTTALRRVLSSAAELELSPTVLDAVRHSVQRFEDVIKLHAGNRSDFDSMLAGVAMNESNTGIELPHRRSAFRALSHIWGTQLDVFSATTIVRRSEQRDANDQLLLTVKRGLRRLRPGARLDIYGYRLAVPDGQEHGDVIPLDADAGSQFGAPLLPEHCSHPLPKFRTFTDNEAWVNCELADEGIGRLSAVDMAFGAMAMDQPFPRDTDGRPWFGANSLSVTPTHIMELNLLIHRPSFGEVTPDFMVFANVVGSDAPQLMRRVALPMRERIVELGRGDEVAQNPDVPDYPRLLKQSCDRMNWNLAEFDALRVRVEYPILHAVSRLYFHVDGGEQ